MYRAIPTELSAGAVTALLALSRRVDLSPGPGGSRITPSGAVDDACRAVIADEGSQAQQLAHAWGRSAFVALYPSAQLVAHTDPPVPHERYHIPLDVNPGCWVLHDGTWQQLRGGGIYGMDPTQEHGAVNWGATVRLHLIVDTKGGD
jgi:hypothetical protein